MADLTVQESPLQESYARISHEDIELFAERLIRQQLLRQHVESLHPVLLKEDQLVQEAEDKIRHIIESLTISEQSKRLMEMSALIRVRNSIRLMIQFHEVDEDLAESVVFGAAKEAYTRISQFSAQGGSRTLTTRRPADFESAASTSSSHLCISRTVGS